ncbi:hypothetical protein LJC34_07060, partial [Oscillospiraceae bacterium OttesenSCG-928-G22]|nr:hypothetical protein [Oscillospiraceae bacterium OttesenSCG-928-G22]
LRDPDLPVRTPMRDEPKPESLSDIEARTWYLEQERRIPELINRDMPLEQQARQAHALRNEFRTIARHAMENQAKAQGLFRDFPNMTWDEVIIEYSGRGFSGDALYREIIAAAQRSNPRVNSHLGVK